MSALHPRRGTRLAVQALSFTLDQRRYYGQQGDTAASALLASGVRLMGRSVKYRRVRGLLSAGPEEPNALFSVGLPPEVIPNVFRPTAAVARGTRAAQPESLAHPAI